MQNSRVGKNIIWYENSDEFYELKKEIFGENCYYIELDVEEPIIADLGAHIGMSTIYFKMLFPQAKMVAFEPIPENFALLKKNIEDNQIEGVELVQAVIAPKSGNLRIQEPIGEGAWKSGAGIIPKGWKGIQENKEIRVEAVGIRELLVEKIDLVKMDIEGMEYEVIRNAKELLRNAKNWIIEVHPRKDHRITEIEKIFAQHGFAVTLHKDESSLGRGLVTLVAVLK